MVHVKKNYKNRNKIAEMSNRRVINSDKTWGGKEKRKAKQGDAEEANPHLSVASQTIPSKKL